MRNHQSSVSRSNVRDFGARHVFAICVMATATMVMTACTGLKTRSEVSGSKHATPSSGTSSGTVPPPPPGTPVVTSQPTTDDHGADALPQATPAPGADTFLSKELPKVGVILGPGGLKAYAHIGVMREFSRAKIPVHAVAGLEWGAMMGAFFAEKGLANDVDWKAFRLRDSDLPSGGMLRGYRAKSMGDFDAFLQLVFPSSSIEHGKVPFGCPALVKREKIQWQARGSLKEAMAKCVPYPPLLSAAGDYLAGANAVEEAAQWLRQQGATLIVLVNVLGPGEMLSAKLADDQYGTSVLWSEVRRDLMRVRAPTVNWVVSVNTSLQKIDDFSARRATVEAGAKAAADLTQKLSKQYGF